ncbi:MAG TPA: sialic acid synthase [Candidatus Magasanikbacteria bacterium]|nr:sialic acid synthase [Candidatus Magasanikbacteria bacterium]
MDKQYQKKFDFNNLFILEMANNHQGSVEHGKRIIEAFTEPVRIAGVKAAIKFQLRNLDVMVHPDYRENTENKHISRFLSTRLSEEQFRSLRDAASEAGFLTMATPYDEDSVDLAGRLGIELVKIASSSAADWPLLEHIVQSGIPIVCSTGGLPLEKVDNLVSFFDHRGANFALMHCVSIYPTPNHKLNLKRIKIFRERYPHVTIGFSTHEDPNNTDAVKIAYSFGARLFERHIGIETDEIKLNTYSSRPEQIERWFAAHQEARSMIGEHASPSDVDDPQEQESLASMMRGVFSKDSLKQGSVIQRTDVFFAMPFLPKQLHSGQWRQGLTADRDYAPYEPIADSIIPDIVARKEIVYKAIHDVKGFLREARISINDESSVELLHPYGVKEFFKHGAFVIHCFNRDYSKKIIIMMHGQDFPSAYQKKKEITIQILTGQLEVEIAGKQRMLYPGDTLLIPSGVWYTCTTQHGVIYEALSTTEYEDDAVYVDPAILARLPEERKTRLNNWGRHQFDD